MARVQDDPPPTHTTLVASWHTHAEEDRVPRTAAPDAESSATAGTSEPSTTISNAALEEFRRIVHAHYRAHARELPWRCTDDPYRILVSEIMLQQTQVARVLPKYEAFVHEFPDLAHLTAAPTARVLSAWQGLGYNRRALALQRCAQLIMDIHGGSIPRDREQLLALPGIGPATAASLLAYVHGEAVPFIETNIRAAILHFFFPTREDVPDSEVLPLVAATLDRDDPRTWYYALMDYGSWLKRAVPNPSRRSRHYTRQSPYKGSRRQLRAHILRIFLSEEVAVAPVSGQATVSSARAVAAASLQGSTVTMGLDDLVAALSSWDRPLVEEVVAQLVREGFLHHKGAAYSLV